MALDNLILTRNKKLLQYKNEMESTENSSVDKIKLIFSLFCSFSRMISVSVNEIGAKLGLN